MHAGGSDFRLYDGFYLKTYLLMRCQGPDALIVVRPSGLPVGLLWYSILFTIESIYLLNLFLYIDLYVLGDDALIS